MLVSPPACTNNWVTLLAVKSIVAASDTADTKGLVTTNLELEIVHAGTRWNNDRVEVVLSVFINLPIQRVQFFPEEAAM